MKINFGGFVKTIVVTSACFALSGCLTLMLESNSGGRYTAKTTWSKDTITGLSLAQDSNGKKGYVFVGKEFDYLLSEGADNVVKLLKDPKINRKDLQVAGDAEFVLNSGKKKFSGSLILKYDWTTEEAKQAVEGYGFSCKEKHCLYRVSNLKGSIHQKNKQEDYSQVLAFNHPFNVGFYKYETSGMPKGVKTLLLPVTITLDIVTLPLQLLTLTVIANGH